MMTSPAGSSARGLCRPPDPAYVLLEINRGLERITVGHLRIARAELEVTTIVRRRRERLQLGPWVRNGRRDDAVGELALHYSGLGFAAASEKEPDIRRSADLVRGFRHRELKLHVWLIDRRGDDLRVRDRGHVRVHR